MRKTVYGYNVEENYIIDHSKFWDLIDKRGWEIALLQSIDKYIKEDSVYIDVGAWIGPTVLYAAQRSKRCYAIEPDSVACLGLFKNLSLNPELEVQVSNSAIMNYCGYVTLGTDRIKGDSTSNIFNGKEEEMVNCITFSEYLKDNKLSKVDFIKIDIEGAEMYLLEDLGKIWEEIGRPIVHLSVHQKFFPRREEGIEGVMKFTERFENPEGIRSKLYNEDLSDLLLIK